MASYTVEHHVAQSGHQEHFPFDSHTTLTGEAGLAAAPRGRADMLPEIWSPNMPTTTPKKSSLLGGIFLCGFPALILFALYLEQGGCRRPFLSFLRFSLPMAFGR
jgi:hypothetical protein